MMKLIRAGKKDLPLIYEQMTQNFVIEEIRDFIDAQKVFDNEKYTIFHINENNINVGFMCIWTLQEFTFLEHFVVYQQFRCKGLGGLALDLLKNQSSPLVLECEPPITHMQIRRLNFYMRHGFHMYNFDYTQPPYRKHGVGCSLKLMSTQEIDFKKTVKELYTEVYGVDYE